MINHVQDKKKAKTTSVGIERSPLLQAFLQKEKELPIKSIVVRQQALLH